VENSCVLIPPNADRAFTCKTEPFAVSKGLPSNLATWRAPTLKFAEDPTNEKEDDRIGPLSAALIYTTRRKC
jgi:hypothetical protein